MRKLRVTKRMEATIQAKLLGRKPLVVSRFDVEKVLRGKPARFVLIYLILHRVSFQCIARVFTSPVGVRAEAFYSAAVSQGVRTVLSSKLYEGKGKEKVKNLQPRHKGINQVTPLSRRHTNSCRRNGRKVATVIPLQSMSCVSTIRIAILNCNEFCKRQLKLCCANT